jgi:hypothetical protein
MGIKEKAKDVQAIATGSVTGLILYRGLIFGSDDALDDMGLAPNLEQFAGCVYRPVFMIIVTLIFNIVIMNLTTAIYSNEYERLEKEAEVHFYRERASYTCMVLLGLQKIKLPAPGPGQQRRRSSTLSQDSHTGDSRPLTPSDKEDFEKQQRFWRNSIPATYVLGLALCYPGARGNAGDYVRAVIAAMLLAYAQESFQAFIVLKDWFLSWDNGREGPAKPHFVWICYRAHLSAKMVNAEDGAIQGLDERLSRLEEAMQQVTGLDQKVDSCQKRLDSKMDDLYEDLQKLVKRQIQIQDQLVEHRARRK